MTAASILDRAELAILRRFEPAELARIEPSTAKRRWSTECPLGRATGHKIVCATDAANVLNARAPLGFTASQGYWHPLRNEALDFLEGWDGDTTTVEDLEAAIAAALAEKGGA